MPAAVEAAVSLLADSDPRVVSMCRSQLLSWGSSALAELRRASEAADPRLRVRVRALLRTLELRSWIERMQRFARAPRGGRESMHYRVLEAGTMLISSVGRLRPPDREAVTSELDRMADEVRAMFRTRSATGCSRVLGEYLANEKTFSGKGVHQYGMESVALDAVLESRSGVAVALTILYLLVGRRTGMRMSAVAMPDHYLIRVHGGRPVLLDPLSGQTTTKGECIRYLRALGYSGATTVYLQDLDDRQLLIGLLGSMQLVFGYREDGETLRALHRAKRMLNRA